MNTGFLGPAVATVLTACGIETKWFMGLEISNRIVATVLTACGIETSTNLEMRLRVVITVATVLTACGIETQ